MRVVAAISGPLLYRQAGHLYFMIVLLTVLTPAHLECDVR